LRKLTCGSWLNRSSRKARSPASKGCRCPPIFVYGARAVVWTDPSKTDPNNQWVNQLRHRRGFNRATVAVANKNARIIWAVLRTGERIAPPSEGLPQRSRDDGEMSCPGRTGRAKSPIYRGLRGLAAAGAGASRPPFRRPDSLGGSGYLFATGPADHIKINLQRESRP
jgi:hypothetical protein